MFHTMINTKDTDATVSHIGNARTKNTATSINNTLKMLYPVILPAIFLTFTNLFSIKSHLLSHFFNAAYYLVGICRR